jgi:hypothetical protein
MEINDFGGIARFNIAVVAGIVLFMLYVQWVTSSPDSVQSAAFSPAYRNSRNLPSLAALASAIPGASLTVTARSEFGDIYRSDVQ